MTSVRPRRARPDTVLTTMKSDVFSTWVCPLKSGGISKVIGVMGEERAPGIGESPTRDLLDGYNSATSLKLSFVPGYICGCMFLTGRGVYNEGCLPG